MPNGEPCKQCEFCVSSQVLNNLQGEGPVPCRVMFVGQSPGRNEEMFLRPMCGEMGRLMDDLLMEAGLLRSQVWLTNAIRCKPLPDKDAGAKHIQSCRPWLMKEMAEVQPDVVVVLGATALQSVMGTTGITTLRGRFFTDVDFGIGKNITVYCMTLPAALFRKWEDYPVVVEDFRKLGRLLQGSFKEEELGDYAILDTVEAVGSAFEYLKSQPRVAFDLETTTFNFWDFNLRPDCNILCASFSAYPGTGFVLPFLRQHAKPFWSEEDLKVVRSIFNDFLSSDVVKWAQNGIFDINFLRSNRYNFNISSFKFDTMLAHHTLQENLPHGLDSLCGRYADMPLYSYELKKWQQENGKIKTYADFPDSLLWKYAGADADATVRVGDLLQAQLEGEMTTHWVNGIDEPIRLSQFFEEIVMPLNHALIDMRYRGIILDAEYMQVLQETEKKREAQSILNCQQIAGVEFNPGSTQQLCGILFNPPTPPQDPDWDGKGVNGKAYVVGFGLPIINRTAKGRPSTDVETLKALDKSTKHPIFKELLSIRKSQKKITTYLAGSDGTKGLLRHRLESTGRVYPDYKQHVAVTGRLAASDPSIHTMPSADTDPVYAEIRLLFTVPEGWWMLQCDYSQLELRIVAQIAQEDVMLDSFSKGGDVHKLVASEMNDIPLEEVTTSQRKKAKFVNFGLIYGRSAYSLAEEYGIPVLEAQKYIAKYFNRFKKLAAYFEEQKKSISEHGYVVNPFGRKRRLYGYQFLDSARMRRYSSDTFFLRQCEQKRSEMERQAINFGVQATGSDVLSRSTAKVNDAYKGTKSGLIISHHDALYVETPSEELYEAAYALVSIMEEPVPELGDSSFPVDLEVGTRWGEHNDEVTDQVNKYIRDRRNNESHCRETAQPEALQK